jgi:hypothetical protein
VVPSVKNSENASATLPNKPKRDKWNLFMIFYSFPTQRQLKFLEKRSEEIEERFQREKESLRKG